MKKLSKKTWWIIGGVSVVLAGLSIWYFGFRDKGDKQSTAPLVDVRDRASATS